LDHFLDHRLMKKAYKKYFLDIIYQNTPGFLSCFSTNRWKMMRKTGLFWINMNENYNTKKKWSHKYVWMRRKKIDNKDSLYLLISCGEDLGSLVLFFCYHQTPFVFHSCCLNPKKSFLWNTYSIDLCCWIPPLPHHFLGIYE